MTASPHKVFISYAHESREHEDEVLALADRLRSDGIDAEIDQYESAPSEGWTRWIRRNINDAKFVLSICTEAYKRRAEGAEQPGEGCGGDREGMIIDQEIYDSHGKSKKFIAVMLREKDRVFIPDFLRPFQNYSIETDLGYDRLYRRLTNQPEVVKPAIGKMRSLPVRERKSPLLRDRGHIMGNTDGRTVGTLGGDEKATLGYDAAVGIVCTAAGVDARNLSRTLNQLGINGVSFQQTVWNGIRKAGYVIDIDAIPNDSSTMLVDVVTAIQNSIPA